MKVYFVSFDDGLIVSVIACTAQDAELLAHEEISALKIPRRKRSILMIQENSYRSKKD